MVCKVMDQSLFIMTHYQAPCDSDFQYFLNLLGTAQWQMEGPLLMLQTPVIIGLHALSYRQLLILSPDFHSGFCYQGLYRSG